jgi:DNA polymerase-1
MYTTGELTHDGDPTGVLYGIFRDIVEFCDLFSTDRIAFCFDGGIDHRLEIYPGYKEDRRQRRKEMDEGEKETRRQLRRQIYRLRNGLLVDAGYRNVFWQEGYEADDVMAAICEQHLGSGREFVIVSTDQDLFQCLCKDRVVQWNPITKRATTQKLFEDVYGIAPSMWAHVKAIAGCDGDCVPGIRGIGEKTASKYVAGTLKATTKAFQSIVPELERIERNLKLVRLPFPGCGPFQLVDEPVDPRAWDKVMTSLGMSSLVGRRLR